MKDLFLTGGTVIDPSSGLEAARDVLVSAAKVAAIAPPGAIHPPPDAEVLDATGCWVVPGLIDVHTHLRDPGFPHKETIESGLRAAAAGGFVAVAAMANTDPVNDNPEVTAYMLARAAEVRGAALIPVGAVSKGLKGLEAADYNALARAGVRMLSDDGMPVDDPNLLLLAMHQAGVLGLALSLHEEDRDLVCGGAINAGPTADTLGVRGIPPLAESERVRRDLTLATGAGKKVHIAHISTRESLEMVIAARERGAIVTCEATPHHFSLDDRAVLDFGPDAKMNPPLRERADVDALRAALADGTIDMIATDHAPHDPGSKAAAELAGCFGARHRQWPLSAEHARAFTGAANGVIGLQTALGLALELVHSALIGPRRLVELMALNPARLLRLPGGRLVEGGPADITVIDPNLQWEVRPVDLLSRSRNTPFTGRRLKGRAVWTIVGGEVVFDGRAQNAAQASA
ncbi:MAG TPA: dihydroorotase [Candidatus Binataceae bacterium]|nr:dihydroorotase [Candidatus Binataceae bacterium]